MDRRLGRRYQKLVKAHMHSVPRTAAGPSCGCGETSAFAATQAAWRFLNNDRVLLSALVAPLRDVGRQAVGQSRADFVLLAHDWCKLDYRRHTSKRDVVQLTHETDVGYELTTALLISAEDGSPLAPMEMHLKTADAIHSTRDPAPALDEHHLQQVLPTMDASSGWGLSRPIVHVIDREADSVGHFREWDDAGHLFLVRADDRRVLWRGEAVLLSDIVFALESEGAFRKVREVAFQGRMAQQWVCETEVVLDRPAKRYVDGRQRRVPGRPMRLRLIVARVRDESGETLGQWLLLSNVVASTANGSDLALWYYWRWRIESFFKLLKSSGQELEHWRQETGLAIGRRLLVAAMACVLVWELQRQETPEAEEIKRILVRLSGRQMKRTRPWTAPALLAGLFVLLPILDLLGHYHGDLSQLRHLALKTIPFLDSG